MKKLPSLPLIAALVVSAAANAASITEVKAVCRHGQVFLTWNEKELPEDAVLSVYASTRPITAENIAIAKLLAKDILPGSARDWLKSLVMGSGTSGVYSMGCGSEGSGSIGSCLQAVKQRARIIPANSMMCRVILRFSIFVKI